LEQSELETLVGELETRVERLRSLYEQYFMGIERLEPSVPKKDVERRLYVLRRTQIRNTGLRFRFQNALLRYNTYLTYWIRICRQIEEGTYKRDLQRANARFAAQRSKKPSEVDGREASPEGLGPLPPEALSRAPDATEYEDVELELDEELESPMAKSVEPEQPDWLEELHMRAVLRPVGSVGTAGAPEPQNRPLGAPRPSPPQRPSSEGSPRPEAQVEPGVRGPALGKPGPPPVPQRAPHGQAELPRPVVRAMDEGLSEQRVRQIYSQYVDAKRMRQESTASITYESLAKSLRDSSDMLRKKHGGKSVDFEVTVKDGKTILRPIVR
jgi:hypothetical protein